MNHVICKPGSRDNNNSKELLENLNSNSLASVHSINNI